MFFKKNKSKYQKHTEIYFISYFLGSSKIEKGSIKKKSKLVDYYEVEVRLGCRIGLTTVHKKDIFFNYEDAAIENNRRNMLDVIKIKNTVNSKDDFIKAMFFEIRKSSECTEEKLEYFKNNIKKFFNINLS